MATTPVTVLKCANKIMTRLREAQLGALTDTDYADLILRLMNDARREVEDAFNWSSLHNVIDVSTVASTSTVAVSDGGANQTNTRSRVLEVFNSTTENYLQSINRAKMRQFQQLDTAEREPTYFAVNGYDSNSNIELELHNTPDAVYALKITAYVPAQDWTDSDDATVIDVPWVPVYLRAYQLALRERGDDEGLTAVEAFQEYTTALNDAIAYDQRMQAGAVGHGNDQQHWQTFDWHVQGNGF